MTIFFFTKGNRTVASSRYRAFSVAEELSIKYGLETIICSPPINTISETPWPQKGNLILATYSNLLKVKKSDIIFIQRAIHNKYFFVALIIARMCGRQIVFDFDDAVYLYSPWKTKLITRISDAVIVGSHALADWASAYNTNVHIIPTSIRPADYERNFNSPRPLGGGIVIGWIGNAPAHYENLKLLVPVLQKVVKQVPDITFRIIGVLGDRRVHELFESIEGLTAEFIDALDWADPEAAPRAIQEFDIGVMPLVDSEWSRSKCAFKAIEYMACAVPAVVSAVGENKYLVENAINGFTPPSEDEWVDDIVTLCRDEVLRKKMGHAGHKKIFERYSLEANIPLLKEIIIGL